MKRLALVLVPALAHAGPPAGLACLARHYAVVAVEHEGAWYGRLPDGTVVPWDDGKSKTLEEALAHPDLEDTLARPYHRGAIRPVTDPDEDPGRVRVDALFAQTYPRRGVVPTPFLGKTMRIHERVAPAFRRVSDRLGALRARSPELAPWLTNLSGTFVVRKIAGTDRPSSHSYGISIDLDAGKSDYWRWSKPPLRWRNSVPQAIVDAFEAEGFIWGGRWYHYDTMHFEYRPELYDCAPR